MAYSLDSYGKITDSSLYTRSRIGQEMSQRRLMFHSAETLKIYSELVTNYDANYVKKTSFLSYKIFYIKKRKIRKKESIIF